MAFSSQGDRIALTQIEQVINGSYVKLGYYDTQMDNLTWLNKEKWKGKLYSFNYLIIVNKNITSKLNMYFFIIM